MDLRQYLRYHTSDSVIYIIYKRKLMSESIGYEGNPEIFFPHILSEAASLYSTALGASFRPKKHAMLVHSSLSTLSSVDGNPHTVLAALWNACMREHMALVMPAHSDMLPNKLEVPVLFDRKTTPCIHMGILAETFRTMRGVKRSRHPLLSFCAKGPKAAYILSGHIGETGLGYDSPLGKLYAMDALVLMLGTGYDTCTALHLTEYTRNAQERNKKNHDADRVTCRAGVSAWNGIRLTVWEDIAYNPSFFPKIGKAFESTHPEKIISGLLPKGIYRLFRIRDIIDFSIDIQRVLG